MGARVDFLFSGFSANLRAPSRGAFVALVKFANGRLPRVLPMCDVPSIRGAHRGKIAGFRFHVVPTINEFPPFRVISYLFSGDKSYDERVDKTSAGSLIGPVI